MRLRQLRKSSPTKLLKYLRKKLLLVPNWPAISSTERSDSAYFFLLTHSLMLVLSFSTSATDNFSFSAFC
jgi:hypothetical protein